MPRIYVTIAPDDYADLVKVAIDQLGRKHGAAAIYISKLVHDHLQAIKTGKIIIEPPELRKR